MGGHGVGSLANPIGGEGNDGELQLGRELSFGISNTVLGQVMGRVEDPWVRRGSVPPSIVHHHTARLSLHHMSTVVGLCHHTTTLPIYHHSVVLGRI